MKVKVFQDAQSIAEYTADQIQKLMQRRPECVLGLATGSTPVPTSREMIKRYEQGKLDFSQVKTYNLDEYLGLSKENSQSFYYFMWVIASPIFVPTFVKMPLIVSQIPEKKDPILLNTFLMFVYASVNFV